MAGSSKPGEGEGGLLPPELREFLRAHTLKLDRPVWGRRHGRHRSARAGVGLDFRDHRPYVPGDDPRRVDWRAAGRRDRLVLRQTESEDELRLVLAVDDSGGMAYGDGSQSKRTVAQAMAGALAWLAVRQGDPISVAVGRDDAVDVSLLAPVSGSPRLAALERVLTDGHARGGCPWEDLLAAIETRAGRRSLLVVVSDLLDPADRNHPPDEAIDQLLRGLAHLRARGHDVVLVQVLHRDELEFPWTERKMMRFEDLRDLRPALEGPGASFRDGYLERLTAHLRNIEQSCERDGIHLHRVVTDEALSAAVVALLRRLSGDAAPDADGLVAP